MSEPLYDIFFSGQIMQGRDPAEVRENIARIFKASPKQLEFLFSGSHAMVKQGLDQEAAVKYRVAFRDAGALVDVVPAGEQPATKEPQTETRSSIQPADQITLLPANTGSLIDCAKTVEPAPLPEISGISMAPTGGSLIDCAKIVEPVPLPDISVLSMAPTGSNIDEIETAPPADIDTSALSLNPPNTGSLEECHVEPPVAEIPDISQLKLESD